MSCFRDTLLWMISCGGYSGAGVMGLAGAAGWGGVIIGLVWATTGGGWMTCWVVGAGAGFAMEITGAGGGVWMGFG